MGSKIDEIFKWAQKHTLNDNDFIESLKKLCRLMSMHMLNKEEIKEFEYSLYYLNESIGDLYLVGKEVHRNQILDKDTLFNVMYKLNLAVLNINTYFIDMYKVIHSKQNNTIQEDAYDWYRS